MGLGDEIRSDIIGDFRGQLAQMDSKLDRLLVIEERIDANRETMARAFGRIEDQETRLRELELAAPVTKERTNRATANWDKVMWGVLGSLASACSGLLIYFVMHLPKGT